MSISNLCKQGEGNQGGVDSNLSLLNQWQNNQIVIPGKNRSSIERMVFKEMIQF